MDLMKIRTAARRSCHQWAEQEFGHADLGDERRTNRLVRLAAEVAASPAGKVTEVFSRSAEREAVFRWVENDDVKPEDVARANHLATAEKCLAELFVFVPVDGSSMNLTDTMGKKGLGIVGSRSIGATGIHVMSAIAVSREGTPIGLCGQKFWKRTERVSNK